MENDEFEKFKINFSICANRDIAARNIRMSLDKRTAFSK